MADIIMTLSLMERRTVQEVRTTGQKLFWAGQDTHAAHVLSAAMAYMRSLAASALENDPCDITCKQIAFVMKDVHQDILLLGGLHLDRASCMGGPYLDKYDLSFRGMMASTVSFAHLHSKPHVVRGPFAKPTKEGLILTIHPCHADSLVSI